MQALIENTSTELPPWQCNLADIARAHVLAAETAGASGRYLVTTPHEVSGKMAVEVLRQRFPQYSFGQDGKDSGAKPFADVTKVRAAQSGGLRAM